MSKEESLRGDHKGRVFKSVTRRGKKKKKLGKQSKERYSYDENA